jgi:hypothetical protein
MRYGTAHFKDVEAAVAYYRTQGESRSAVARKLAEQAIFLGPPILQPGQTLSLDRSEGRYFIEEQDKDEPEQVVE